MNESPTHHEPVAPGPTPIKRDPEPVTSKPPTSGDEPTLVSHETPPGEDEPSTAPAEDEPTLASEGAPAEDAPSSPPAGSPSGATAGAPPFPPPPPRFPPGPPPTGGPQGGFVGGGPQGGGPQANYVPFAARYGLVRPVTGRYFAGVCAAIGRATNTDPLLWRVLLAVLAFFGGIGLVVYLLGWLLIPAEGDTASPFESLLGRGQSSASPTLVIVGSVVTGLLLLGGLSISLRQALIGAAVIFGAGFLLSRRHQSQPGPGHPWRWTPPAPPSTPPGGAAPTAPLTPHGPYAGSSTPPGPAGPHPSGPFPPHPYAPTASYPTAPPAPDPYAPTAEFTAVPPTAPGFPAPAGAPAPVSAPKPRKRPRSLLGRLTLSVLCIVVGVLVALNLAGVHTEASTNIAIAIVVVAGGLLVGTWFGRARGLIALGLILSLALGMETAAEHSTIYWDGPDGRRFTGNHTWNPGSVSALQSDYRIRFGNGTIDLRGVDFAQQDVHLNARGELGNLVIILPPTVDVDVTATVQLGEASVFGEQWDGPNRTARHIRDTGPDGEGGGHLALRTDVRLGNLEVHR